MKKNKKLLTALGSLTLCAALCMGVAGCSNTGKKDADNKTATTTANDVYATSAVSSAAYLNTLGGAGSVNGSFNADGNTERPTGYIYQNMTEIKNNIVMFEKLVSSNIKEKIEVNEDKTSYNYEYVMTVTVDDDVVAQMYYNQSALKTETETDEDDGVTEEKVSCKLEGLIVYGEGENKKEYAIYGEKELETEGDESEFSIEFRTYKDEQNYVQFSYSTAREENENETSYEFEIYKNGARVQKTEFEFEHENGRTEISLTLVHGDKYDGKLEIVRDTKQDNVFYVSYKANGKESKVTVTKTEDAYKFTFKSDYGTEISIDVSVNA